MTPCSCANTRVEQHSSLQRTTEFQYYNDRSALDNSSEGPKICNYSVVALDASIMAPCHSSTTGRAFISSWGIGSCWSHMVSCLLFIIKTNLWWATGNITQEGNFQKLQPPHNEEQSGFDLWTWQQEAKSLLNNFQTFKANRSTQNQKGIIPHRSIMSSFPIVILSCEQDLLAPAILQ